MSNTIYHTPYTYLIKFKPTGQVYYGVRYAKNCHPNDLWTSYFTSSKTVKILIEKYGKEAFDYEIRRTFNSVNAAREWESKVLQKINVIKSSKWLNKTNNKAFPDATGIKRPGIGGRKPGCESSIKGKIICHNPVTNKEKYINDPNELPEGFVLGGKPKTKEHNKKVSLAKLGYKKSKEERLKMSKRRKGKNTGSDNSNAKPVKINEIQYGSKIEAMIALNISRHRLNKLLKNQR